MELTRNFAVYGPSRVPPFPHGHICSQIDIQLMKDPIGKSINNICMFHCCLQAFGFVMRQEVQIMHTQKGNTQARMFVERSTHSPNGVDELDLWAHEPRPDNEIIFAFATKTPEKSWEKHRRPHEDRHWSVKGVTFTRCLKGTEDVMRMCRENSLNTHGMAYSLCNCCFLIPNATHWIHKPLWVIDTV